MKPIIALAVRSGCFLGEEMPYAAIQALSLQTPFGPDPIFPDLTYVIPRAQVALRVQEERRYLYLLSLCLVPLLQPHVFFCASAVVLATGFDNFIICKVITVDLYSVIRSKQLLSGVAFADPALAASGAPSRASLLPLPIS